MRVLPRRTALVRLPLLWRRRCAAVTLRRRVSKDAEPMLGVSWCLKLLHTLCWPTLRITHQQDRSQPTLTPLDSLPYRSHAAGAQALATAARRHPAGCSSGRQGC